MSGRWGWMDKYRGRILGRDRKDRRAKSREDTLMGAMTAESRGLLSGWSERN